nr:HNH endonuclease family protein [Laspinema sp. D2d]
MKKGRKNSCSLLDPDQWVSTDFKTIEHVAPQNPDEPTNWDKHLYESDNWHRIGNLILLPTEINSSAGNKGWIEKWIYYQHLAEKDPDKLASLNEEAKNNGVNLNPSTLDLLKNTSYSHHVTPLVELGAKGLWDKSLVDRRTERICDILWERMHEWLEQATPTPKVTKKRVTKERE